MAPLAVASVPKILESMRRSPADVRFDEALKVAAHHFGKPRIKGSHHIFKMPWPGPPAVNLQRGEGSNAKPYQIRELLAALARLAA